MTHRTSHCSGSPPRSYFEGSAPRILEDSRSRIPLLCPCRFGIMESWGLRAVTAQHNGHRYVSPSLIQNFNVDLNIHRFNNERLERLTSCPTVKHPKTSTRNLASANQPYILSKRRQENDEMVMSFVDLACMGGPMRNIQTYLTRGDLPGDPLVDSA